jgi:two-component system response regulator AtoC
VRRRVLIVDDDPASAQYMALALERERYETETASSGLDALRVLERAPPSAVLSDLRMPEMNGLDLLGCIQARWPEVPVVLVSVEEDVATVVEAVHRGAVNYLIKPVSPAVLATATAKAIARRVPARLPADVNPAADIVGESAPMAAVRQAVALASRSDVNVVLVGETGTGKELVARAIHGLSGGAPKRFVAHNCAMTPPDMFDSEFFGHVRGAFTGAHRDRSGLLRDADRGVLFLDELECMSLANQAKLLRVLDDGEVRPVGSERAVTVSVRFVAATNRVPQLMLAAGELREDVYYRLRGFEIGIPPLRERPGDIPILAQHFLAGSGRTLSPAAAQALQRCCWPGNVRQLRNVIRCAIAKSGGPTIDASDLDLQIPGAPGATSAVPPPAWPTTPGGPPRLDALEDDAIRRALAAHDGNRSRAARDLGIHRSTLIRRLRDMGIAGSDKGRRR